MGKAHATIRIQYRRRTVIPQPTYQASRSVGFARESADQIPNQTINQAVFRGQSPRYNPTIRVQYQRRTVIPQPAYQVE